MKRGTVQEQVKTGLRSKWRTRFAVLNLQEKDLRIYEREPFNDELITAKDGAAVSYCLVALRENTQCVCVHKPNAKRQRKHNIFKLVMAEEDGGQSPTKPEVILSSKTPEERDDWVKEINDVINGRAEPPKLIQNNISIDTFDVVKVQTDALQHLNKTRPKFHGRRRPRKRPLAERTHDEENIEGLEKKFKTADSNQDVDDFFTPPTTGVDSDAEPSKGPSSSCSYDDDTHLLHGKKSRQKKNKKGSLSNTSPTHAEVKRRQKTDRSSSFFKRLSNRFSQVFGHGAGAEHGGEATGEDIGNGVKDATNFTPSLDSFEVSEDMTEKDDLLKNLTLISEKAGQLQRRSTDLRKEFSEGENVQEATQHDVKYVRLAVKHLVKSFDTMSLVERKTEKTEE